VRAPVRLMAMILIAQMSLGSRADGASEPDRPSRREPHPFKPGTSLNIGHWQTDVVNVATQMLRYTL
jgi:hypothetical protein